jgi:hypothetical protein
LGICRLDHDHLTSLDGLHLNVLLRVRWNCSGGVRFLPHPLDCGHHVGLLRQECIPQVCGPAQVFIHAPKNVGKRDKGLNRSLPVLLCRRAHQGFSLQAAILLDPDVRFMHFHWIGRRCEYLREERIRIQRNRSDQTVELVGWQRSAACVSLIGLGKRRDIAMYEQQGAQDCDPA